MFLQSVDNWLHALPNIGVFTIIPATLVLAVAIAPQLRRLVYRREVPKEVSDGAADAFKSIVTFMVFLLAFSLVLVQGHFHAAEEIVTREANTINTLDRQLWRLTGVPAGASRRTLQAYARSIVRDEWATMAHAARAEETSRLLGELYGSVLSMVIILNKPFSGETVVSPDPIERVLRAMEART